MNVTLGALLLLGPGQLALLVWLAHTLMAQTRLPGEALNVWLAGWLFCGILLYMITWLLALLGAGAESER